MKPNAIRMFAVVLFSAAHVLAQNPPTSVDVDANVNRHPINPNIYGVAYGDAYDMATLNASLNRWGGNSTTRYNWQIDAHSAAADWYFETYSDGSGMPGGSADIFVATTRGGQNGAEPMFTIPMIDYLANLGPGRETLEGFSVAKYGAQTAADPWNPDAGNGVSAATGSNITGNDPLDTGVPNSTATQKAWVQHFVTTYGPSSSATGIKYYILDNEPSIWYSTHRDVHPNPATYDEIFNKILAYATVIRAADPTAKIAGPEEWSWWAMYFSGLDQARGSSAVNSDYNTHNQTYYYPWLLQKIQAYKQQTGTQLIDILTVHAYNATPGGSDDSLAGQQARNRETRILWDPNFQDPSWYGDIGINGRVLNWIPTLRAMVNQYCPGIQIGCTEYNWGDEANLNGATTQADVLGIYGREGFDLATRWTVAKDTSTTPTTYYVTYLASQIYRNYDGNKSTFGDTSVSAGVANPDNLSAFAAVRSSDGALTVMVINKQQGSTQVTVSLANFSTNGTAQAWQINSASPPSIVHLADITVAHNAITTTVPSQSITLFVVPAGSVMSRPSAPTGLKATAGDAQVALSWTASGGATSYNVYRGTAAGAEAATAIATGITTTSHTNTGLTNGTPYFYKVAAVNAGGVSPLSNEASATPQFAVQLASQTVAVGGTVTFSVTATGAPAPTYQWQVLTDGGGTWTNLTDTTPYSATTTDTLTITGATTAMNGDSFRCMVTSSNSTVPSATAALVVYAPLTVVTRVGSAGVNGSTDGSGSEARFADPADVATDAAGNVYVADTGNHTVRKVTPAGVVTTFAGLAGVSGSSDGSGTARFNHPSGVAVDSAGNVYVADTDNNEIRKVTITGVVTTVAGLAGVGGSDDGTGSAASFNGPSGIVADAAGDLFVADTLNHTIRKVTPAGVVSTVAGVAGASGATDAIGSTARFHGPQGLALDASNNLFVADTNNNAIRKVVTASGVVTTVAGRAGIAGSTDGANSQALFHFPCGVAVDGMGNLYVADTDNHTLREIASSGAVSTLAGLAGSSGSADGAGTAARFAFPTGVAVDSSGDVYVADTSNHTIRLAFTPAAPLIAQQPQSQTVTAGNNVTFSVTATGKPAPAYQWYFNGTAMSGATNSILSITNVQTTNAGNYTVTVTNSSNTATSNGATLTVNPAADGGGGGGSGGGGGGGAPSLWFSGLLSLLALARRALRRRWV
jgi:hypothetical protein